MFDDISPSNNGHDESTGILLGLFVFGSVIAVAVALAIVTSVQPQAEPTPVTLPANIDSWKIDEAIDGIDIHYSPTFADLRDGNAWYATVEYKMDDTTLTQHFEAPTFDELYEEIRSAVEVN